ncbi:cell division protein FtsA [Paraliobacillus ryukyuensis]|uniref:cell division protein FtsA n=1 Tax=Paraliobacillus ryukyuensis TaxID=200904 RepID=UPI0009A75F73|nr:cell division protein FtsA [Paraliobacillus ryukyuensis]
MKERIFALDIGTRSVVGLLLEQTETHYTVLDYVVQEHQERSMLDGQIHDVVSVSRVIQQVKEKLEQKHHITLTKVCVAAAGRALKTKRTTITKNIATHPLLSKEDLLFFELSAVQQAQHDLALEEKEHSTTHYYCVGYSVLQYKLDQDSIGSLIDQQGEQAEVEIIATFLPKVVVESLIAALQRANLEMEALTLEPIAAINVLIPASMRRLNVALVDIGAGTSDIALTDAGTITAYGMVPKAGDEITEAISDQYLLDFNEAERVKKDITTNGQALLTDILGFEQTITMQELADSIKPAIEHLADAIAEEIIMLNAKAPKAVMLVGGGSLTPFLTEIISQKLQLPDNRVAIRGTDAIPSLKFATDMPEGPAFITPIGIAIAAKQNPVHYISVTVNDRAVRLFDMKQLTVGDCLLAAGIHIDKLYGRPGIAYMIRFNEQPITLPGTYGKPPKVWLNGELIHINEPIKHGDVLHVEKGEDGTEPTVAIEELVGDVETFTVYFNHHPYPLKPVFIVNNGKVDKHYLLKDNDKVHVSYIKTAKDFFDSINLNLKDKEKDNFTLYINAEKKHIPAFTQTIIINGEKASASTRLKTGDRIEITEHISPTVSNLLDQLKKSIYHSISVTFNGEPITIQKQHKKVFRDGKELDLEDSIQQFDHIELKSIENDHFIFQDIFNFVSIDLSEIKPGVEIKKNGEPATFLDVLAPNDAITIK